MRIIQTANENISVWSYLITAHYLPFGNTLTYLHYLLSPSHYCNRVSYWPLTVGDERNDHHSWWVPASCVDSCIAQAAANDRNGPVSHDDPVMASVISA